MVGFRLAQLAGFLLFFAALVSAVRQETSGLLSGATLDQGQPSSAALPSQQQQQQRSQLTPTQLQLQLEQQQQRQLTAATASKAAAQPAAPNSGCNSRSVGNRTRCQACQSKANTATRRAGCSACEDTSIVPAPYTSMCQSCLFTVSNPAVQPWCHKLLQSYGPIYGPAPPAPPANKPAVHKYYGCLAAVKDVAGAQGCRYCYDNDAAGITDAANCYKCVTSIKLSSNAGLCVGCWRNFRTVPGAQCQACLNAARPGMSPVTCAGSR